VPRIQKILVPVDFSPACEHAARYAIDLARQLGGASSAEIDFVHAWQLAGYATPTSELAKDSDRQLREQLDGFIKGLGATGVTTRGHVRIGVPYAEVVAAASELKSDLIVMGTTGKTGLEHFLVGSVAERVVRSAEVPVVTVRLKKS
jgi:nucleotide-binding universal stress UspA family protein